jgi:hypothetical protein
MSPTSTGSRNYETIKQARFAIYFIICFFIGQLFDPEDGDMFSETLADFQRPTQHYLQEDITLYNAVISLTLSFIKYSDAKGIKIFVLLK